MTPTPASRPSALIALFEARGFARLETPILQPAGLFLELSGEAIRRRLYLTQDASGGEHCLRPEHTIPVCRHHLASGREAGDYTYLGPVFRQRPGETGEFLQAGIESIGGADAMAADAAILALALEGLAGWAGRDFAVRTGDMDLIEAVLRALDVPRQVQRRLIRQLASGGAVEDVLSQPAAPASDYAGLLAAIEGQDPRAARAFVEDVISIAGIAPVGGRSAAEIAERFLSRAANRSGAATERASGVLRRYFAIEEGLAGAAASLKRLAADERLDIGDAIARFARRVDLMAASGIPIERVSFAAGFSHSFDYYTGFVFEVRDREAAPGRFVAAGGRYDRLLQHLGSPKPLPAVGVSFWLDRLEAGA